MEGESAGLKQLAGKTARPPPETRAAARRRTEEVEAAGAGGTFGPRQEDVVDVEEEATDAVAAQGAEGDGGNRYRVRYVSVTSAEPVGVEAIYGEGVFTTEDGRTIRVETVISVALLDGASPPVTRRRTEA